MELISRGDTVARGLIFFAAANAALRKEAEDYT